MKKSKWTPIWIAAGLGSALCAFVNPYIGWFAAGNLALVLSGLYLYREAWSRTSRLLDNRKLLKKMSKQQQDKFVSLDRQETKNVQVMCNMMMPLLTVANACLNVYCYIYYHESMRIVSIAGAGLAGQDGLCIGLIVIDLLCAALFYYALRKNVDEIMDLPVKEAEQMRQNRKAGRDQK